MRTDIGKRNSLERDALKLEEMASFMRSLVDDHYVTMPDWKRHDKERELRSRIKQSIEILIYNMPV